MNRNLEYYDKEISKRFSHYVHPFTKKPIQSAQEYLDAVKSQDEKRSIVTNQKLSLDELNARYAKRFGFLGVPGTRGHIASIQDYLDAYDTIHKRQNTSLPNLDVQHSSKEKSEPPESEDTAAKHYEQEIAELRSKLKTSNFFVGILAFLLFSFFFLVIAKGVGSPAVPPASSASFTSNPIVMPSPSATPKPTPNLTPKPTPTPRVEGRYHVTASFENDWNDSVGSDWSFYAEVNGISLGSSGTYFTLQKSDVVDFYAECTENDSYPDIGKASRYTVIDASDLEGDFSVTFPVTVTEGHGRYAGNTARFSVTFYFELQ